MKILTHLVILLFAMNALALQPMTLEQAEKFLSQPTAEVAQALSTAPQTYDFFLDGKNDAYLSKIASCNTTINSLNQLRPPNSLSISTKRPFSIEYEKNMVKIIYKIIIAGIITANIKNFYEFLRLNGVGVAYG